MKRAPTQIVIINTLMRYARANFTDPAILEAEKAAKKVPKEKRAKTEKKKVSLRRVGSLLYVACCMLYVVCWATCRVWAAAPRRVAGAALL